MRWLARFGEYMTKAEEKINEKIGRLRRRGERVWLIAIAWSLSKLFITAGKIDMSKIERVEEAVKAVNLSCRRRRWVAHCTSGAKLTSNQPKHLDFRCILHSKRVQGVISRKNLGKKLRNETKSKKFIFVTLRTFRGSFIP
jgi:hypothetical protein